MVRGQTLAQFVKEKVRLSVDQARRYICKLLQAVSYLHYEGVAHRDLKPDNIIVDLKNESIKVIDFNTAVRFSSRTSKEKPVAYLSNISGGTGLKQWSAPETRL